MKATLEKVRQSAEAARRAAEESQRKVKAAAADLKEAEDKRDGSTAGVDSAWESLSESVQQEAQHEGRNAESGRGRLRRGPGTSHGQGAGGRRRSPPRTT